MPLAADSTERFALRDSAFFAFAVMLLLPSIWSTCSITGQDEYWLSFRTVLEMQERSEWLTPYVNGEVRLQKPPLLYWLMRCSFELFGSNLFAARIWTVLAGATMALFTAKLARSERHSGYLAGCMVLGCAGVMVDARRAMFDLPVGALCTVAIHCAIAWHRRGRLPWALAAAIATAAASMTKGPVALWFVIAPLLAALLTHRSRPNGPLWHWLPALLFFCALALPWPLWAQAAHPDFWQVMAEQAESRAFGFTFARVPAMFAALLGLIVPWSFAVLAGAWSGRANASQRWLTIWVLIGLVPFLLMKSFERYVLALVPPMAVLAAHWLSDAATRTQRLQLTLATALLGVPVVVFALFTLWFGMSYTWSLLAIVLLVLTVRVARRERPDLALTAMMVTALLTLLLGFVYPSIGINRLPDDLPADLHRTHVQTFARPQPGMLSMRLGRSVQQMSGAADGLGERLRSYHGYLFALADDCARIESAADASSVPWQRVTSFHSFYSRKAWLKFFRQRLTADDWLAALASRSAQQLMPEFVCYWIGD